MLVLRRVALFAGPRSWRMHHAAHQHAVDRELTALLRRGYPGLHSTIRLRVTRCHCHHRPHLCLEVARCKYFLRQKRMQAAGASC